MRGTELLPHIVFFCRSSSARKLFPLPGTMKGELLPHINWFERPDLHRHGR